MPKKPSNDAEEGTKEEVITALASEIVLKAAVLAAHRISGAPRRRGGKHVSRQSSNPGRRKGTAQDPCRVQAPYRRALQRGVLHHQPGREDGADLSLRGVAADRGEAGAPLQFQSYEEKAFEPHQLLRPAGGDGWPGPGADSGAAARRRGSEGRGSGAGQLDVSGSPEHGSVPQGDGREPVHS